MLPGQSTEERESREAASGAQQDRQEQLRRPDAAAQRGERDRSGPGALTDLFLSLSHSVPGEPQTGNAYAWELRIRGAHRAPRSCATFSTPLTPTS